MINVEKNYEIINKWINFTKYDANQKTMVVGTLNFSSKNTTTLLLKINETYDPTGTLGVLLAKQEFIDSCKYYKETWWNTLTNENGFNYIKDMYDAFFSDYVKSVEDELLNQYESIINQCIPHKQIGTVDLGFGREQMLIGIYESAKAIDKMNKDVFLKGGPLGVISNVSTHIHIFPTISHCVTTLESAKDGLYLCYIDNNHRASGFFGWFLKSNGNIFSINERVYEAYAGNHGTHRNGRQYESKEYNVFPYNFIFSFGDYDYKGYAHNHIIDEDKLAFMELGQEAFMPLLSSIMLIKLIYKPGTTLDFDPVYIDALAAVNIPKLANPEDSECVALAVPKNSEIAIRTKDALVVEFTTEDIKSNAYSTEFSHSDENNKKSRQKYRGYQEYGCFSTNVNQILVDTYGQGFKFDPTTVFESSPHLNLPEKALDRKIYIDGNYPRHSNDQLIGTKQFMRLQAYYQARKQLADYISENMQKAMERYPQTIYRIMEPINESKDVYTKMNYLCTYIEAHLTKEQKSKNSLYLYNINDLRIDVTRWVDSAECPEYRSNCINDIEQTYDGRKFVDKVTKSPAKIYYKITFRDWIALMWFYGENVLPETFKGWIKSRGGVGNSLLDVVDPVERLYTPYEYGGSHKFLHGDYSGELTLGYSKRHLASEAKQVLNIAEPPLDLSRVPDKYRKYRFYDLNSHIESYHINHIKE